MALVTRLARLFRADFNAVLDRVEEPELLLRQALREMREELARDRQSLQLLQHERQQCLEQDAQMAEAETALEAELAVCLDAQHDDLARHLLKRKLKNGQLRQCLARRGQALDGRSQALSRRLEENTARYQDMCEQAELFDARVVAEESTDPWGAADNPISDADVEVALLAEKQRRTCR